MAEKFKILKRLGAGGFATNYLVEVLDQQLRSEWGVERILCNIEYETKNGLKFSFQGFKPVDRL